MKTKSMIRGQPSKKMLNLTGFLIIKASHLVEEGMNDHFGKGTLKARHICTLRVLLDESATQQQLCEWLWIDRATMTQVIRELLKFKYVRRTTKEGDRRSYVLSLTASGKKFVTEQSLRLYELDQQVFSYLSAGEVERLQQILAKLMLAVAEND